MNVLLIQTHPVHILTNTAVKHRHLCWRSDTWRPAPYTVSQYIWTWHHFVIALCWPLISHTHYCNSTPFVWVTSNPTSWLSFMVRTQGLQNDTWLKKCHCLAAWTSYVIIEQDGSQNLTSGRDRAILPQKFTIRVQSEFAPVHSYNWCWRVRIPNSLFMRYQLLGIVNFVMRAAAQP